VGPDSAVGIATCYGLDGLAIESLWRQDFPLPSDEYRLFPNIQPPGRDVDHPPPSSAEVNERFRAIPLLSTWAFMSTYRVKFTFTFTRSKREKVARV
jgi:hypothetical protein